MLSAAQAINNIIGLRGEIQGDASIIPLFLDMNMGKEVSFAYSRKVLSENVREAGLSEAHTKRHSLRIGGATDSANSAAAEAETVGFIGFWT